jgi:hypothetical protein
MVDLSKITDHDLPEMNRVLGNFWRLQWMKTHRELVIANRSVQRLSAKCKALKAKLAQEK